MTRPKLVISETTNKTDISLEDQAKVRKYVTPNVSERLAALSASVADLTTDVNALTAQLAYKEYIARVLFTSTGVTVEQVLNNTLEYTLTFARSAAGRYTIVPTPAGSFGNTTTYCRGDIVSDPGLSKILFCNVIYNTTSEIEVIVREGTGTTYSNTSVRALVEIRQY